MRFQCGLNNQCCFALVVERITGLLPGHSFFRTPKTSQLGVARVRGLEKIMGDMFGLVWVTTPLETQFDNLQYFIMV